MKTYLIGEFSFGSLSLSYLNAFKKLKCEVYTFDLTDELRKINPFATFRILNNYFEHYFYKELNMRLLSQIKLVKPDLIFVIKGSALLPETILQIKSELQSTIFCFNPDNPFNLNKAASNELIRKSLSLYDCYFIWGKFLMEQLKSSGAKRVEYLPFAYDPELHYPVSVSDEEKVVYGSDVVFIGTWDQEREEFLKSITDFDLSIWGSGWGKSQSLKKLWKGRNVFGEEFSKVCNSSKINLNHIRKQNGDAHNMKTFEIPGCGGFMLTKRTGEQLEFLAEGKEIACYEGVDELREKIKYYLTNDEERKQIALAGYNKVSLHPYESVINNILKVYYSLK